MGVYRRGKSWVIDFYYRGKRYTESCRDVSLTLAKEREIAMNAAIFAGTYKPPRIEATRFKKFSKTYLEHSTNVRDESCQPTSNIDPFWSLKNDPLMFMTARAPAPG